MAQKLIDKLLDGSLNINSVLHWLKNPEKTEENDLKTCKTGEFASYFLNYIHEEAQSFQSLAHKTPVKQVHTPKSVEKFECTRTKRRSALFSSPAHSEDSPKRNDTSLESPLLPTVCSPLNSSLPNVPRSEAKARNLCFGDFVAIKNSPQSAQKNSRRINPTVVSKQRSFHSKNTYNFNNDSFAKDEAANLETPRKEAVKIYEEEKEASKVIKQQENKSFPTLKSINVNSTRIYKEASKEIIVNLNLVTSKPQLDILIELYVFLVNEDMVLNIASELYFILTILLSKQFLDNEEKHGIYFSTVHNLVYFAIKCLQQLKRILAFLDKATLRLLQSNERLLLDETLAHEVQSAHEEAFEAVEEKTIYEQQSEENVCFVSETDSRENFPSDSSFHAFRKQRDMFYDLLSVWKRANRSSENWNFHIALAGRIRSLLNLYGDSHNLKHLSRLVQKQLLASCLKAQRNDENIHPEFLQSLPNMDSAKLSKLTNRLIIKDTNNGLRSLPVFTGHEEFYKEFINVASNTSYAFIIQLRNVFVYEILLLNANRDPVSNNLSVDAQTRSAFETTLRSLRILAKFLGYIETLPYNSPNTTNLSPTTILSSTTTSLMLEVIASRQWQRSCFDLEHLLLEALQKRSVFVFVPWIAEYLAMLDAVTLRLPFYHRFLKMLFELYRNLKVFSSSQEEYWLVKLHLGWLFELAHFPSELYFTHFDDASNLLPELKIQASSACFSMSFLQRSCAFLGEFRKLLQSTNNNTVLTSKHITPVTAIENNLVERNETKLKVQLQEAFLNSKPPSMRKTIEFVSERIASAVVKEICNVLVPKHKEMAKEKYKRLLEADRDKVKLPKFKEMCLENLIEDSNQIVEQQIAKKVASAINSLLSDDELEATVQFCAGIASDYCKSRVSQWISTRISEDVFKDLEYVTTSFDQNLVKEKAKFSSQMIVLSPKETNTNIDEGLNPSFLISEMQKFCVELLEGSQVSSCERLVDFLHLCMQCKALRSDLNESAWFWINTLLLDMLLLHLFHTRGVPNTQTTSAIEKFTSFWAQLDDKCSRTVVKELFKSILCPRNLQMIHFALVGQEKAWENYGELLEALLRAKLVENFELQCVAIFRNNYSNETLQRLSKYLKKLVERHKCNDSFLLSFMADYCVDLEC